MEPGIFSPYVMIEMQAAYEIIEQQFLNKQKVKQIAIQDAVGKVLHEDIKSPISFPAFRASVMDGYAVNHQETPNQFEVQSAIRAGDTLQTLQPGHAIYVTTGSPVPLNSTAVVPIEKCSKGDQDKVDIPLVEQGQWIREIGSDIQQGEIVANKGYVLGPQEVALLAGLGVLNVTVLDYLTFGLLSTGDELVDFNQTPLDYQIRDSNSLMLQLLLQKDQCQVYNYGICKDDYNTIQSKLIEMSNQVDVIITSGGVSMGDRDYVKPILAQSGIILFGRVNMKPGKPTTFGILNDTPIFALPGNPVSCFVTYHLFVHFAICKATLKDYYTQIHVSLGPAQIKLDPERPEYHRATVVLQDGQFIAVSTGKQQSSRLISTRNANALLILPKGNHSIQGQIKALLIGEIQQMKEGMMQQEQWSQHSCSHHIASRFSCNVGILTISDRVFNGIYEDKSGVRYIQPCLVELVQQSLDCQNVLQGISNDDFSMIQDKIIGFKHKGVQLLLTTGGTGFAVIFKQPRDNTPEATKQLLTKKCSGLKHRIIQYSLQKTPMAALSRGVCGIIDQMQLIYRLIVNLPGSIKGASESFEAIKDVIPHAIQLINSQIK